MISSGEQKLYIPFTQNLLTNQEEFSVRVGASYVKLTNQIDGIPLRRVLSVTYITIAIKELSKNIHSTLYANDFTIFISASKECLSKTLIQYTINKLKN